VGLVTVNVSVLCTINTLEGPKGRSHRDCEYTPEQGTRSKEIAREEGGI
jgi:hypothetical protein